MHQGELTLEWAHFEPSVETGTDRLWFSECRFGRYIGFFPAEYRYRLRTLAAEAGQDFYDQDKLPSGFPPSGTLGELKRSLVSIPNLVGISVAVEEDIVISSHDGGDPVTKYPAADRRVREAVSGLFEASGFRSENVLRLLRANPRRYLHFEKPGTLVGVFRDFDDVIDRRARPQTVRSE